jgi:hypothetical protein
MMALLSDVVVICLNSIVLTPNGQLLDCATIALSGRHVAVIRPACFVSTFILKTEFLEV